MEIFGRATWLMFIAGAIPTGLAGWWIGSRVGYSSSTVLATIAISAVLFSAAVCYFVWRWFVAPLRELERGLERWTKGDLGTPLSSGSMVGWKGLARQFSQAQIDLQRSLEDARVELALERTRLQTLIEKLPDAIIMTNMRGEVLFFNASAMSILGATTSDVRTGGRALFAPLQPELWRMPVQEVLKKHSAGELVEFRGVDDVISSYRTTVTMFNEAVTGDLGVLIMLRDVTAKRRLEELKEEFFQSAAHDLRAPLFAIQGYLRLLRKSLVPDERQSNWIEAINISCEKLTLLVKDALDSARIESGNLRLSATPVDARVLARRVAQMFKPLADERGVVLDVKIATDAPPAFEADERLIERLFHNLVSNALKFTPRGGHVIVQVSAYGDLLELSVEDDGPGIPESQRIAIFERFRQLDALGPKSGFGLGLSICAKIVKLHRGVIWVEPGQVQGSKFVIRLPLNQRTTESV